jgi:hypothetical protein
MQRLLNILTLINTTCVGIVVAGSVYMYQNKDAIRESFQTVIVEELKESVGDLVKESLPVPGVPSSTSLPKGIPALPL